MFIVLFVPCIMGYLTFLAPAHYMQITPPNHVGIKMSPNVWTKVQNNVLSLLRNISFRVCVYKDNLKDISVTTVGTGSLGTLLLVDIIWTTWS